MIFWLWRIIQLWLPYWIVLQVYKAKKSLPANLKTRQGRTLKAIMITTDYGIIFSNEKYVENRTKKLADKKRILDKEAQAILTELNSLNFEERENIVDYIKQQYEV